MSIKYPNVIIAFVMMLANFQCQQAEQNHTTQAAKPMNVLFIAVDDLRPELGCYGKDYIHAPNIDRLAAEGLTFDRAYCQQAVCSPSRTSLLTGLRPDATGIYDLQTHFRDIVPEVITLPQHFKQNGYHTEFWGKIYHAALLDSASWSVGGANQDRRVEPQWPKENWRAYVLDSSNRIADQNNGGGLPYEMADVPDTAYPDGKIAEHAIHTLQTLSQGDQPFFLGVGFYKPHLPFNAPKKYWDMYDPSAITLPIPMPPTDAPAVALTEWGELRAYASIPAEGRLDTAMTRKLIHGYRACVSYTDTQIGKVLDELDRLGIRDNTIVVLWGDHGWKLGDYGDWCKHTNFEIDAHAPLIVSVPDMANQGKHTRALVEFVDIYPTLSELVGLSIPSHVQGKSFVPLLENPEQNWKTFALSQFPRQNEKVMGYSIRTDQYRFTRWENRESGEVIARELYQHTDDPIAKQNLAELPDYTQEVQQFDTLLSEAWKNSLAADGDL